MFFQEINEKEFDKFARKFENKCYLQSSNVGNLRRRNGWDAYYLGVFDDNKLVAATLLLGKMRHLKKEFYAIRGPLVDFRNKEIFDFLIDNLKKFVKEHQGYMLRIDPYVEELSVDKDGNPTGKFDNSDIKNILKKHGFIETKAEKMLDTNQAKFMYVLELNGSIEDIMKDMESKTRQMIRKNEKNGIVIRFGSKGDIPLFSDIMKNTGERRGFVDRGEKFYSDMYECLDKDNMISLVFAELDTDLAKEYISKDREEIEKAKKEREINRKNGTLNEKKAQAKEKEEEIQLEKLTKKEIELDELAKKYGNKITIGAILFILYENEVAALSGGCYAQFRDYQPFYTINYEMIKYGIEKGYKRYNFYAIINKLDKNDEQYGIYEFKRGFGGHVMQLIGEYVLPVDKMLYNFLNTAKKIKKICKK